jgi:hypothetical protein
MIKTLGIAALALTMATGVASSAQAQEWRYHQHNHYHGGNGGGNGGAVIGGLLGGMIIGGMLVQPRYEQAPVPFYGDMDEDQGYVVTCRAMVVGTDWYGRPVFRRVCR